MAEDSSIQRITRLTPLSAILALIESRVEAVKAERRELARALGCVLAEDVAAQQLPRSFIALRDGFAVEAAAAEVPRVSRRYRSLPAPPPVVSGA